MYKIETHLCTKSLKQHIHHDYINILITSVHFITIFFQKNVEEMVTILMIDKDCL